MGRFGRGTDLPAAFSAFFTVHECNIDNYSTSQLPLPISCLILIIIQWISFKGPEKVDNTRSMLKFLKDRRY